MILFKIPIVISPKNRDLHLSECHGFGKPFALFIYLKKFDDSKKYIEQLMVIAPDMGRAYQELGHIYRDMGDETKSVIHYRQACELNPALLASWSSLYKYFTKKNNQPAADHAREQIEKLQSLPSALLYIDQIMNEGRLGIAERQCRAFLKKNPKTFKTRWLMF